MRDVFSQGSDAVEVPEHILDMVPERAAAYVEESKERLLAGLSKGQRDAVLAQSTHNIAGTPERRELHRTILQKLAETMRGSKSETPLFLYFAGPMGVGKTTLVEKLDQRIAEEAGGATLPLYQAAAMEDVYQAYKQAVQYYMVSDFQFYKRMLPEFEQSGKNFTIIRAEASGLDQAVTAWAQEAGVNLILEQLGDGVDPEWAAEKARMYNWFAVGITADPAVNAQRLEKRCQSAGQEIKLDELARTIRGFSLPGAFAVAAAHAQHAVLLNSGAVYQPICTWEQGQEIVVDPDAYKRFKSYADLSEAEILERFRMPNPEPPAPGGMG